MKEFWKFFKGTLKFITIGSRAYYLWIAGLLLIIAAGTWAYSYQIRYGLIITGMRDEVSWGMYIANFTFLIGITDAAVLLLIPAYLFHFKPIKEITVFGILLAAAAVITSLLFVILDLGHPERFLHLLPIPGVGRLNFPASMLAWDVIMINGYLFIALLIPLYMLYKKYCACEPNWRWATPLLIISIPWAVGVHMITAFLFNGLAARPFWNASILAPRFLTSAFCTGLALVIIIFQIIRRVSRIRIEDEVFNILGMIVAGSMFLNLFLLAAEFFKEYYSGTIHVAPMEYLYRGLYGRSELAPWIWTATILNVIAFFLFLIPETRKDFNSLNAACVAIFLGVYIEKGPGLILPGFTPGVLGELYYVYVPTVLEMLVTAGIWSIGALIYTLMLKVAIPIETGEFCRSGTPVRD